MLEAHLWDRIVKHGPGKGIVLLLGDQQPTKFTKKSTLDVFKSVGYSDVIDIDYNGKARLCVDLNEPVRDLPKATVLYDGGTAEHVANIGEVFQTIVFALEIGGIVVQAVPVNVYGESYYNLQPALLVDFYELNGFQTIDCTLYVRTQWTDPETPGCFRMIPINGPASLYASLPPRTHVLYVGKKTTAVEKIRWPHQSNYPSTI